MTPTSASPAPVRAHADRALPARLRARYRLVPWWQRVSVIWLLSRLVTTTLVLALASVQGQNPWTPAKPGYTAFANMWDALWYNIVAVGGYPSVLPVTVDGHVGENAWAFMPGYPAVVRVLMLVTGAPWASMAVVVSVACSLGTALLFYRLMRRVQPESTALFAVVLFCAAPLSPLLQFGYAESMQLLLLTLALLLVLQRRYLVLVPVIALMALTRPSGLAFALFLALHVGFRWYSRVRDPFPVREAVTASSVAVFSGLMGLAWPAIAWAVTGSPTAYTDTELAWRSAYIGYQELVPFAAWFQSGVWWLGQPLGILVVVAVILGFTLLMFAPAVRSLGVDLRLWVASYALYLLAVFFPQSSVFRLLMPMFPLLGALARPRSIVYRVVVTLLLICGQWGWLLLCWGVDGADWTPP
ncbi:hypothetical protein [Cryobacterium arcticum]|uniref:Membrane protein n=1 Tax=Cryobacterium arcticum TaxID=670052 RepID=A0A1B1BHG1_9MICO|nr:hypothetical protein [Cryobacterium arcticum]ANP71988.1 Membrane protein [Cryobacterium arcticum]